MLLNKIRSYKKILLSYLWYSWILNIFLWYLYNMLTFNGRWQKIISFILNVLN